MATFTVEDSEGDEFPTSPSSEEDEGPHCGSQLERNTSRARQSCIWTRGDAIGRIGLRKYSRIRIARPQDEDLQ